MDGLLTLAVAIISTWGTMGTMTGDELDGLDVERRRTELQDAGVSLVLGTMVNASGLTLAKSVPVERLAAFVGAGMGTAPVWDVFTVDGGIAFTDTISAVGDRRLRLDLDALRVIGGDRAWAPTDVVDQHGDALPTCPRTALRTARDRLADLGVTALVGHELEFVLVGPDGAAIDATGWVPYGISGMLDQAEFLDELVRAARSAGVVVEQVHAEYGRHQFELSLPPTDPVPAADQVVLAKIIVGTVARRHGLRASFSPAPFPGSVGNGAHQHLSFLQNGVPVFSGGTGPHGLTAAGGSVIGGLVDGLPEVQGFLTGSVLSGARLAPGTWSGAFACWGLENREAAVRFLAATPGNPHGAHVEVKPVDPSANVYLASAALLGLAAAGLVAQTALPAEVADDPTRLDEAGRDTAGIGVLSNDPETIIGRLEASELARRLMGAEVVAATVAVRRLEQQTFGEVEVEAVAQQLRLAWSV